MKALLESLKELSEARVVSKLKDDGKLEEEKEFMLELAEKAARVFRMGGGSVRVFQEQRLGEITVAMELPGMLDLTFDLQPRRGTIHIALLGGNMMYAMPGSELDEFAGGNNERTIKYRRLDDRLMSEVLKKSKRIFDLYERYKHQGDDEEAYRDFVDAEEEEREREAKMSRWVAGGGDPDDYEDWGSYGGGSMRYPR